MRRPKKEGQREEDLKDLPREVIPHDVSKEELNALFGEGNYKRALRNFTIGRKNWVTINMVGGGFDAYVENRREEICIKKWNR